MYETIFVPVDNSEHALTGIDLAVELGKRFGAELVGSHAYAARMHDYRFKQMEFTLPEEYLVEAEMEKQRKVHDTLITMGLELISDSYLVVMEERCRAAGVPFTPKMYDGKNWRVIVRDIEESGYDLVVIGALGLGAVKDSLIGSVCERVCRRVKTDVLVVKNTAPVETQLFGRGGDGTVDHVDGGGIVVGIDGSPESFAGLRTALALGKALDKPVEAVSVYDPYLHYAMFNSIVNVLTERASKVFKFKEQEQLHEEVIDTGLAKIYQSHLEVARRIAADEGYDLKITLLDGKAFEKLLQYVRRERPWLLVLGRIGVHSEADMDIGSNTENLLRLAPCNVLLSSRRYTPPLDTVAEETMRWTEPALQLLRRAPDFARGIARTTIHRWAMERGHSVITQSIVEQAMATILPRSAMIKMGIIAEAVAIEQIEAAPEDVVTYVCPTCGYAARGFAPAVCAVCGGPGDAFEKIDKEAIARLAPLEGPIEEEDTFDHVRLKWTADARNRLREVPDGYQQRRAKAQIEKSARVRRLPVITLDLVEDVLGGALRDTQDLQARGTLGQAAVDAPPPGQEIIRDGAFSWTAEAVARLNRVPEGFMRKGTKKRMEDAARRHGTDLITLEIAEEGIRDALQVMEEMIKKKAEK
ncbi:universal stress protein [Rhodocaloribacter litoris]|uniref:universal stress protein n=1 Tax=Rhodocaloribacter litoris TaxID=2558931 RepID=UPI00141DC4FF|nr:universal stress protein [Rhodocaloribacter litoris]QXD15941.1 universal stress protein [Rhodocaloribacter litoris]